MSTGGIGAVIEPAPVTGLVANLSPDTAESTAVRRAGNRRRTFTEFLVLRFSIRVALAVSRVYLVFASATYMSPSVSSMVMIDHNIKPTRELANKCLIVNKFSRDIR